MLFEDLYKEYEKLKERIIESKSIYNKPFGNADPRKGLLGCCVAAEASRLMSDKYGKIFNESFTASVLEDYKLSIRNKEKAVDFFKNLED